MQRIRIQVEHNGRLTYVPVTRRQRDAIMARDLDNDMQDIARDLRRAGII